MFFSMLFLALEYFFRNFAAIKGNQGLPYLFAAIFLGVFLLLLNLGKNSIQIKKSFLFVCLFFSYFIMSMVITTQDTATLKAYTVASTGGILFFYFLAVLLSINAQPVYRQASLSRAYLNLFNFLFLLLSTYILLITYGFVVRFLPTLSEDLFVTKDAGSYYQRRGVFLSISFILYSVLLAYFFVLNKAYRTNIIRRVLTIFIVTMYLASSFLAAYLAQMIASNNALVCILGLLFATYILWMMTNSKKTLKFIEVKKITIPRLFLSQLTARLSLIIVSSFLLLLIAVVLVTNYFGLELTQWRIMGYGSGEITSLSTRYELLDNFFLHMNYGNPLLGNMMVDSLTTGQGTHVHSFPLALLTHLGIIGFIFFFCYLFFSVREKMYYKTTYMNNSLIVYQLMLLGGFFMIASVGTFFTWPILWFLLSFVFNPISLRRSINE